MPEIDRQQAACTQVAFRADAAFARPAIYETLEARGVGYAIRIPANKNLELAIEDLGGHPHRRLRHAMSSCLPIAMRDSVVRGIDRVDPFKDYHHRLL